MLKVKASSHEVIFVQQKPTDYLLLRVWDIVRILRLIKSTIRNQLIDN